MTEETAAPDPVTVAVLDAQARLVGYRRTVTPEPGEVIVPETCDLPPDGTYKWDGAAFVPLGFGFGKPARPPVPQDYAVFLMMKSMLADLPDECRQWCDWYETNMRRRTEEPLRRGRR